MNYNGLDNLKKAYNIVKSSFINPFRAKKGLSALQKEICNVNISDCNQYISVIL